MLSHSNVEMAASRDTDIVTNGEKGSYGPKITAAVLDHAARYKFVLVLETQGPG